LTSVAALAPLTLASNRQRIFHAGYVRKIQTRFANQALVRFMIPLLRSIVASRFCANDPRLDAVALEGRKFELQFAPELIYNELEEHWPTGRDRTFLPNNCFQTGMSCEGGNSGGPVFLVREMYLLSTAQVAMVNSLIPFIRA
jgi:hypothetical protein